VVQQSIGGWQFKPIHADPNPSMGRMELTLSDQYRLFWKDVNTIGVAVTLPTNIGYEWSFPTGGTDKTIRYGYAKPNQPRGVDEAPSWYEIADAGGEADVSSRESESVGVTQ